MTQSVVAAQHTAHDGAAGAGQRPGTRPHIPMPTPTPTVVSLEVAGMTPLTSIGETVRLSATANVSDGSRRDVEYALVLWLSSDPWVAAVSNGIVT